MERGYLSIDLGGSHVGLAIGDGERLTAKQSIPTEGEDGPERVLERIAAEGKALAEKTGTAIAAAGMGIPGLVDREKGMTKFLPNLPGNWRNVEVASRLGPALGCPVYLLNDVRTATLGELVYGHGRTVGSMVFLAIGTGVGGGIVIDGQLRLGAMGAAGELGHQTILPDGPRCGCGSRGCLETLVSGPAISAAGYRLWKSGLAPKLGALCETDGTVTPLRMQQVAPEEASVREAIAQAATYLGIGVANMITALHPELVVIGGGVAGMGELLLQPMEEEIARRVKMMPVETVRILTSALGPEAGLFGAMALARNGGKAARI